MSFITDHLPDSLFGLPMPWANHPPATEQEASPNSENLPTETLNEESQRETPLTEQLIPQEILPELEPSESVQDGLSKLKLELFSKIENRAEGLHKTSKALNTKIHAIDEFLSLIQQWSTEHPNEAIDCKNPEILKAVEALRQQGIRVPLPEKSLELSQIGGLFTVLGNQRSLLADEMKEASSEFQQCVVERNTFLQHLMTTLSCHSRVTSKISTNFTNRH